MARGQGYCLAFYNVYDSSSTPVAKNYAIQYVNSAKVEKFCAKLTLWCEFCVDEDILNRCRPVLRHVDIEQLKYG